MTTNQQITQERAAPQRPILSVENPFGFVTADPEFAATMTAYDEISARAIVKRSEAAARLVRQLFPTAATLVFECSISIDAWDAELEAIRDGDGRLLWYGHRFAAHPQAVALADAEASEGPQIPDIDPDTAGTIECQLEEIFEIDSSYVLELRDELPQELLAYDLYELDISESEKGTPAPDAASRESVPASQQAGEAAVDESEASDDSGHARIPRRDLLEAMRYIDRALAKDSNDAEAEALWRIREELSGWYEEPTASR